MIKDNFEIKDEIIVERRKNKMESKLVLRGDVVIERRKNGKVIDREELENLIVNAGKVEVAKLLGSGVGSDAFSHIAIGEGTTAPVVGDTTLETEQEREAATVAYEASYKCTFEKTFSFGSATAYDITEAGVFNDAVAGDMLDRFTFSAKAVDSDTDLYIKVTITVA